MMTRKWAVDFSLLLACGVLIWLLAMAATERNDLREENEAMKAEIDRLQEESINLEIERDRFKEGFDCSAVTEACCNECYAANVYYGCRLAKAEWCDEYFSILKRGFR